MKEISADRITWTARLRSAHTFQDRLKSLWDWIVSPAVSISDPEVYQKVRLLAALLVVLLPIGLAAEIGAVETDTYHGYMGFQISVFSYIIVLAAYFLNRSGRVVLAAWISIFASSTAIFILTFDPANPAVDPDFLTFLVVPLLFAGVFLSNRVVLVLTAAYLIALFVFTKLFPTYKTMDTMLGPGSFIVVTGGMIYLINHYRSILEKARRLQLVENEQRYRTLFEAANDAILLVDMSDHYIAANQKAFDMLGYTEDDLIGSSVERVILPGERCQSMQVKQALLAGESVPTYERTFLHKNGTMLPTEVNITLVRDRYGRPLCVQSIVRDITERKLVDERLHRQLERLKALREIDRMITGSLDLQLTLRVLLQHAAIQLNVAAADVLIFNPHLHHLEVGAAWGELPSPPLPEVIGLSEPLCGDAWQHKRLARITRLLDNTSGSARLAELARRGFVAAFAAPLTAKGAVNGVLEVFLTASCEPSMEWIDFLETLAGQAAIAVDNSQLFHNLQRSNLDLIRSYDATLEGWAKALELRDKETEGHSQRVTRRTVQLGRALGLSDAELIHLRRGALLHDIGKMGIPDAILLKPGPLTEEEWQVMKQHPVYAREMLASIPFLAPAMDIPYYHHERWDGSGYPNGLSGSGIPLPARIFAVVDVWDALVSDRPYRRAWSEQETRSYLLENAGVLFDGDVVSAFLDLLKREA